MVGRGAFGLVGADEPRYAQVAREMLDRSDWVTPTLQGKPWLEKPVLYYWQAMLSFRVAGVSDQAARLPAAFDAALLIAVIYFFLRRFRPGSELDGALITASCAAVVGFARAAATDMPLASCFAIALLAWYAWYESRAAHLSCRLLYFSGAWNLSQRPGRARSRGRHHLSLRRSESVTGVPSRARSGSPASSSISPSCCPGTSPSNCAIRNFSVSSFSNTISPASRRMFITTASLSGSTCPCSCWP